MVLKSYDADTMSIGEYLIYVRSSKKITLDEVVSAIKIRKHYIEALEQDKYSMLPERTYTLGYLRSYSNYLEIDNVDILIDKLDESYSFDDPLDLDTLSNKKPKKKEFSSSENTTVLDAKKKPTKDKGNILFLIIVAIVIIVAIIWGSLSFLKKDDNPIIISNNKVEDELNRITSSEEFIIIENDNQEIKPEETTKNKVITASPELTKETVSPAPTEVTVDEGIITLSKWPVETLPREISLSFKEDVWVKIYDSQDRSKVYLARTFIAGQIYNIPGAENLVMDVGNYKGFSFVLDSKNYIIPPKNTTRLVLMGIPLNKNNILNIYKEEEQ